MELFATAARGTEVALRDELREFRFWRVRADRGGVNFEGDLSEAGRACLESRIAVRVLAKVGEFDARDAQQLYDGIRSLEWRPWLTPKHTLAVSSVSKDSALTHTQFIAQRTKDAIVDQLRDATGARPSVDREDADLRVFVHLVRNRATVHLDASGESLHRRGWRPRIGEAPLKETLAAALLRMSGWDRRTPLYDPMCGSGTIAIEADLWARKVAPGILRKKFGFERWPSHTREEAGRMKALREEARARVLPEGPAIEGSDIDPKVLDLARENAKAASSRAVFRVRPLVAFHPSPGTWVVTNPPYGERLEADAQTFRELGRVFGQLPGCDLAILSGTPALEGAMRIRPTRSVPLWNGPIECRLLSYEVGR